jgi:hypothetical protein
MASMADSRWVGVYSSSFEIRSIALGSAFRNTCKIVSLAFPIDSKFSSYLTERMRLDLGKLMLHVVGVHCADLVARRGAEHFDNLDELVNARLTRE